jgi:hypothetical protein
MSLMGWTTSESLLLRRAAFSSPRAKQKSPEPPFLAARASRCAESGPR